MALITFEDLPNTSTPANASNLNNNFGELNTKINNINTYTTFSASRNNNNPTAGSWSKVYNNIQTSSSIPAGTYLILASYSFSTGSSVVAGDLASVRIMIDNSEPNSSVRSTIPFINNKVCSGVTPLIYTFSTTATHTLNIEIYSTTSDLTGWYDMQFDFIKLY